MFASFAITLSPRAADSIGQSHETRLNFSLSNTTGVGWGWGGTFIKVVEKLVHEFFYSVTYSSMFGKIPRLLQKAETSLNAADVLKFSKYRRTFAGKVKSVDGE